MPKPVIINISFGFSENGQFDILSGRVGSGGSDRFPGWMTLFRSFFPGRFPSSESGNGCRRMIPSALVQGRAEFRIRWVRWSSSGYGSGVWFSNYRTGLEAWNPYAAREIKNPPAFGAGGFLGKIGVNDRELPTCFFEGKRMLDAPSALHLLRVGPGHDACLARMHIRTRKPPERSGLIGGCGDGGHVR